MGCEMVARNTCCLKLWDSCTFAGILKSSILCFMGVVFGQVKHPTGPSKSMMALAELELAAAGLDGNTFVALPD